MLTEIFQALVNIFRGAIWKILPTAIAKNIDPDSPVGDTICIIIILSITVFVVWLVMFVGEQVAIDSCLDLGGKWDYENHSCITQN
jgi:hypothetical protein